MSRPARGKAYSKEFRETVVKAMQTGQRTGRDVAKEFGVSTDSVRRWVRRAKRDNDRGSGGVCNDEFQELQRLRRENRKLKMEVEILWKASDWFAR